MSRPVTLGMVNVLLKNQPLEERRARLLQEVDAAGKLGCQIVLLPEFADHHVTHEAGQARQKSIDELRRVVGLKWDSPFIEALRKRAQQYGMAVIPNVLWTGESKPYNRAVVIGPEGTLLGHYDKTHLAPEEEHCVARGGSLKPITTPFGKLGIFICYDVNFPEIPRCYELQGADLLLWTTMRQCETEDILYGAVLPAVAYTHKLPLAVATYVTSNQRETRRPMTSAVYNAWGLQVAGGKFAEGVVAGALDLDDVPLQRRAWGTPEWVRGCTYQQRQRRPDLYGSLTQELTGDAANPAAEPTVAEHPELLNPKL